MFSKIIMPFRFFSAGERKLRELIKNTKDLGENHWDVDDIIDRVTVENLCSCQDPIHMAFEVLLIVILINNTDAHMRK